jgi:hypothetical protein
MAFSFLYLAVRTLLGALVRSRRGMDVKDVELLVLRHELEVLRRQVARQKLRIADRALLAAAAVHLPRPQRALLLVTPRTLLRWNRALARRRRARTRAGATAGSAGSWRSSAFECRRRASAVCLLGRGSSLRRAAVVRAGASS